MFVLVPAFGSYTDDHALDERRERIVGVVDSVDPEEQVKHERMKYHYVVDDRTYHGSADYTNPSMAGREIKLVYDPENPGNSRVDLSNQAGAPRQSDSGDVWATGLGGVMVVAAAVWFLRRRPWWITRPR